MHVVMKCPCGASLKAPNKYVGKQIKCPKCATMLIVPAPPVAAVPVAQPEIEVLESPELDPLFDPLQSAPPVAPLPRAARPPGPARTRAKSKQSKRGVNWILIGSVAAVALVLFGGALFFIYSQQASDLASTATGFTSKGVALASDHQAPDWSNVERVKASANKYDSGQMELQDPSILGSDFDLEFSDLIERVEPSIVRIKVESNVGDSVGSGFFIDHEGKIATNWHVVQNASKVTVSTADGKSTEALGTVILDREKDVAIIQVNPKSLNIVPLPIADNMPRRGDKVAAFGAPQGFSFSATEGIISSIRSGKEVKEILQEMTKLDVYARLGYTTDTNWIQTSAAISGGNSGGPLVNMRGEMVGINTWTHPGGQNLNFASTLKILEGVYSERDGDMFPYAQE